MSGGWWKPSWRAHPLARLLAGSSPLVLTGTSLTASGCANLWAETDAAELPASLAYQQQDGWNVGDAARPLTFPGALPMDVAGGTGWQSALTTLAPRLAPAAAWQPYYAPALFQSLEAPLSADLRAAIQPIYTSEMAGAYRRGQALLSLFIDKGVCRNDVALVLDVAGPEAVALAAALSPCFEPVFMFDNWPHPDGVVPAHLTLAAALYFLPAFEQTRAGRGVNTAPVFVLDRQRLAPYQDDAGRFDNRYFAGLPTREALQTAGIRHLLYVTPDAAALDADDLNGDLAALDQGSIDVKMLALSDFSQTPLPEWLDTPDATCPAAPSLGAGPVFYFGGSPVTHGCFAWWYGYGWNPSVSNLGARRPINSSSPPIPPGLAPRCRFRPVVRPTALAGGGWHAGGWHSVSGWASGLIGRSGSMGRAHGGFAS